MQASHRDRLDEPFFPLDAHLYLTRALEKILIGFLIVITVQTLQLHEEVAQLKFLIRIHGETERRLQFKLEGFTPNTTLATSPAFDYHRIGTGVTVCTLNGGGLGNPELPVYEFGALQICAAAGEHTAALRKGEPGCYTFADEASAGYFMSLVYEY